MEVYHDETEIRRNAAEALARHAAPRFAEMLALNGGRFEQPVRVNLFR